MMQTSRRRVSPGRAAGHTFLVLNLTLAVLLPACGGDSTGPEKPEVRLALAAGNDQFVLPGAVAELPLRVRVTDAGEGTPVDDIDVRWQITTGSGANLLSPEPSDEIGIASVRVQAGATAGNIVVEASADRLVGPPAEFTVRVVQAPTIDAALPAVVTAGAVVTINGNGFSSVPSENTVLFGGLRGSVQTATTTSIVATAPACILSRTTEVRVSLGPVTSNGFPVETVSGPVQSLDLMVGQAVQMDDPPVLACIDMSFAPVGSEFLVVASDVSPALDLDLRYELLGITGGVPVAIPGGARRAPTYDFASEFELGIRKRERMFGPPHEGESAPRGAAAVQEPVVGESRKFKVLKPDKKTSREITAVVRHVSDRAVLYVDEDAPSGGFSTADLVNFGQLFDDPIYETGTTTFGPLSDIDGNSRVIILLTPAVNALTPREQAGFIAGYFYGCDLVSEERCSDTNRGEIFYAMVPDPGGEFSAARSKIVVLRNVPAVLAHELQHMINFSRRGALDVLWLSEGMAHAAEDIVADEFLARGDFVHADEFRRANYQRAQLYLRQASAVSRLGIEAPGSLEMRGAAWLFVKHVAGHQGGAALLERMTGSTTTGAANVAAATGKAWSELSADFAVALWADGAPELSGSPVDSLFTFPAFDLRSAVAPFPGGFPALADTVPMQDFLLAADLPSASQKHLVLRRLGAGSGFRLAFTGPRGGPFATGIPALTILRIR